MVTHAEAERLHEILKISGNINKYDDNCSVSGQKANPVTDPSMNRRLYSIEDIDL